MLFISTEDFFRKAAECHLPTREEELSFAARMRDGDPGGKEALMWGYLPHVASAVRHVKERYRTLELIFRCCTALEKAVDSFDFFQDSETFSHRLSWWMRQTVTRYIVDHDG